MITSSGGTGTKKQGYLHKNKPDSLDVSEARRSLCQISNASIDHDW